MSQAQGGGAVNLTYSDQVTPVFGRGDLVFAGDQPRPLQPEYAACRWWCRMWWWRNLARRPGNRLEALPLSEGVRLSPGQYEGRFTIWFYHPDGSRAQVSTEVPIAPNGVVTGRVPRALPGNP